MSDIRTTNQPNLKLTSHQTKLHETALGLSREHRDLEARLCECLREIDQTKLFKKLGHRSLFIYATRELGLTEAVAYAFISVARKSHEIPELKASIEKKTLSVAKASRLVSGLTAENAHDLITFATTHSTRDLEQELARRNPERVSRDRVRFVSNETVEIRTCIAKSTHAKLKRVVALLAQRGNRTDLPTVIDVALDEYIKRHDPVEKAKRSEAREKMRAENHAARHSEACTEREGLSIGQKTKANSTLLRTRRSRADISGDCKIPDPSQGSLTPRRPLSAPDKHEVFLRDQGRCTHVNEREERCNSDRWLLVHHIKPVSHGGTNDPENLTLLCSFHHDLVHQLSFAMGTGELNWLRSPLTRYEK